MVDAVDQLKKFARTHERGFPQTLLYTNEHHQADLAIIAEVERLREVLKLEEERNEVLMKRLDKARAGSEPDFCYDPAEWEFTCDWDERDQVHSHGEGLSYSDPMLVFTLVRGPRKWVANVPTSFEDDGSPDEHEVRWFDSEEEARAAISAKATTKAKGAAHE